MNFITAFDGSILSLTLGLLLSVVFIMFGLAVDRYKCYFLIAGYNSASEEVRKQYDIQGLASHLGNGLITLGVLMMISTILLYFGLETWFSVVIGILLFVVFILLIGSRKFMPARKNLTARSPIDAKHPFLFSVLPDRMYRAIENGTRQWLQECLKCGHRQDFWEAGGVRYKAVGEPRKLQMCTKCQEFRFHKIRKKTQSEFSEFSTAARQ